MTFQPIIPLGGFSGWTFLKRTMVRQQEIQQAVPANRRDEAYFRDRIGRIDTAEQLVADRRLLRISLTAFGLEADLGNRAFIRKVLEGGTLKPDSLANRLANKQYQELSAAFGFGDFSVPRTKLSDFADKLLTQYRARSFEVAVGQQQNSFRLALNAEREIPELARRNISETAKWFTLLGSPPLREVMQTAFGLPRSFASIDLDQQVSVLRARTASAFGTDSISQFAEGSRTEALVQRFLIRADLQSTRQGSTAAEIALQLLRR